MSVYSLKAANGELVLIKIRPVGESGVGYVVAIG